MCEDFRLKAPNFINFANELVCSRYLRMRPFSAGGVVFPVLAGPGPARTAKKPSPVGNAVAAESPPVRSGRHFPGSGRSPESLVFLREKQTQQRDCGSLSSL